MPDLKKCASLFFLTRSVSENLSRTQPERQLRAGHVTMPITAHRVGGNRKFNSELRGQAAAQGNHKGLNLELLAS